MEKEFVVATFNYYGESVQMVLSESGILNCGPNKNIRQYERCVSTRDPETGKRTKEETAGEYIRDWMNQPERTAEEKAAAEKYLAKEEVKKC